MKLLNIQEAADALGYTVKGLRKIVDRYGLYIVEDSAQALGATFDGTKAGAFGEAGAFSFYPAKMLGTCGDGGAITTNHKEIADRVVRLRDHGRVGKEIVEWSFNCRLDNLHAAILDMKLKHFPGAIERRREIASIYNFHLSDVPGLHLPVPPVHDGKHFDVYQNYEIESECRDGLENFLQIKGIETMRPWGGKAVHQFKALGLSSYSLPRTEKLFRRAIMLPMHTELSDQQIEYVARSVKSFHEESVIQRKRTA